MLAGLLRYDQFEYSHSGMTAHVSLKSHELLILTMLSGGDRHGYGIRQDIIDHTGGEIEIEAGNLYRHIRALEDRGLVIDVAAPRGATDERRIYYRITPRGRQVLAAELHRLRELVRLGESRGILTAVATRRAT
jgi:DNA-binding PadR family transcriptional regulator